jgi:predicted RNase H-like nuclease
VDGYPRGWIAAVVGDGSPQWLQAPVGQFRSLVDDCLAKPPARSAMAVDMPIGLADQGWRECDLQAKARLGRAHARVFLTPPRGVVQMGPKAPNEQVQSRCRELTGKGISRQAMALAPRILDVDACVPDSRIIEAHPELSFAAMAGEVLASKHRPEGIAQRIEVLADAWATSTGMGDMESWLARRPADVPIIDALDALAVAWTALRHLSGLSQPTPSEPPIDARGIPMCIVT